MLATTSRTVAANAVDVNVRRRLPIVLPWLATLPLRFSSGGGPSAEMTTPLGYVPSLFNNSSYYL
jgi:hypothetical protein